MKTKITTLRKIADRLNIVLFQQGSSWIVSHKGGQSALPYSIKTEREALISALSTAREMSLLVDADESAVVNA